MHAASKAVRASRAGRPSGSRQPAHVASHHQALPATAVTIAALSQGVVHARVQWQRSCSTMQCNPVQCSTNQCSLSRSMLLKALFRPRRAWAALGCFRDPTTHTWHGLMVVAGRRRLRQLVPPLCCHHPAALHDKALRRHDTAVRVLFKCTTLGLSSSLPPRRCLPNLRSCYGRHKCTMCTPTPAAGWLRHSCRPA